MVVRFLAILVVVLASVTQGKADDKLVPSDPVEYRDLAFYPERWRERELSTRMSAWNGKQVVVLTTTPDFDSRVMAQFVARLDGAWLLYKDIVGESPRLHRHVDGKPTIAAVPDAALTCGAGCGYVGATGIEVAFFYKTDYPLAVKNPRAFNHYLFYEMGRNFFVFGDRHSVYTTGFAVFMRYVCMDALNCEDPDVKVRSVIEEDEDLYARSTVPFLTAFTNIWGENIEHEHRLRSFSGAPIVPSDANCMYAAVMLKLRRDHGGDAWAKRFCHILRACPEVAPTSKEAVLQQSLNWLVAASAAARTDLTPLFVDRYRMPLSRATREALAAVDWSRAERDPAGVIRDLPVRFDVPNVVRAAVRVAGSRVCPGQEAPKAILPAGDRILVVNQRGEVWAHQMEDRLSRPVRVPGAKVCPGDEIPKAIFLLGKRIAVVNQTGEVWVHDLGDAVGDPKRLPGALVCPDGEVPKAMFPMGASIVVVSRVGEVWIHAVLDEVGRPFRLEGAKVCPGDEAAKAIFSMGDKIIVINRLGEVWAHPADERVGAPTRMDGALVCGDREIPKAIMAGSGEIVVVNRHGEVWSHRVR
jgi:hypothetical protein